MNLNVNYTVHSCAKTDIQVPVQFNGQTVNATMNGVVVELVSEDASMTHTIKLVPNQADLDDILARYTQGARVTADFLTPDYVAPTTP